VARVEWTRQTGDDVEAVVGMLICNFFPNAIRVQPSQGDGGLDIFVPGPVGFARQREVFQVKRYSERLNSSQKRKIRRSLESVIETATAEGWEITKWHLVMPLDPTDNELRWFEELTTNSGFPCELNGLLFCDTLAANYPKVIDYYLRDGKDRLVAAMNSLTQVISGRANRQDNAPLAVGDVVSDLASIHRALNEFDPFYRYEFGVSDNPPPDQPAPGEPGLVGVYATRQESVWITVKIFALSRAAFEERPIAAEIKIAIPAGDGELRRQFDKFVDYGAPMTMPAGTISGSLDLPGGLTRDVTGASLRVLAAPTQDDLELPALALAIVEADSDVVIARTLIRRTEVTSGQTGVRSFFSEQAGLFTVELLVQAGRVEGVLNLAVSYNLEGRRPSELVDGLKVLTAWRAPNRLALGLTYGPRDYGVVAVLTNDREKEASRYLPICEALARLQDHVPVLLRMPPEMTGDQALKIRKADKLMAGEALSGPISSTLSVTHREPIQIERDTDAIYEFWVIDAIEIELGDKVIKLAKEALLFRGRFLEITEAHSVIQPVSEGLKFRYSGELEETRVLARPFHGAVSSGSITGSESDMPS
jgi:hypothetical protein